MINEFSPYNNLLFVQLVTLAVAAVAWYFRLEPVASRMDQLRRRSDRSQSWVAVEPTVVVVLEACPLRPHR